MSQGLGGLPAADNHAHANPVRGIGAREIARRFRAAGGAFIAFVSLPTWSLGLRPGSREDLERAYSYAVEAAAVAREEGLSSVAIVGLHPAESVLLLKEGWEPSEVVEFGEFSVRLASRFVSEGLASGFGEYGRPHWEADRTAVEVCERTMVAALEASRDTGGVVHLHTERRGEETVESIYRLVLGAGADPSRVVLHHAQPSSVGPAARRGLVASVPAGRKGELEEASSRGPAFVVESDFMDDPERPGAVIPPWRIPRRLASLMSKGLVNVDWYASLLSNYEKLYGIKIER